VDKPLKSVTSVLGDRGTCVQTTCPRLLPEIEMAGSQTLDLLSRECNALTINTPPCHVPIHVYDADTMKVD